MNFKGGLYFPTQHCHPFSLFSSPSSSTFVLFCLSPFIFIILLLLLLLIQLFRFPPPTHTPHPPFAPDIQPPPLCTPLPSFTLSSCALLDFDINGSAADLVPPIAALRCVTCCHLAAGRHSSSTLGVMAVEPLRHVSYIKEAIKRQNN